MYGIMHIIYLCHKLWPTTAVQATLICTRSAFFANYYHQTRVKIREKSWRDDRIWENTSWGSHVVYIKHMLYYTYDPRGRAIIIIIIIIIISL